MGLFDFTDRDIPPRAQIVEKCVLHLLNSKDWMAVLNVDIKEPYVQVIYIIIGNICVFVSVCLCIRLLDLSENRCIFAGL